MRSWIWPLICVSAACCSQRQPPPSEPQIAASVSAPPSVSHLSSPAAAHAGQRLDALRETHNVDDPAPDRSSYVALRGDEVPYVVIGQTSYGLKGLDKIYEQGGNESLTHVMWAPNSRVFAINVSDGSAVGGWHSIIYRITGGGAPTAMDVGEILSVQLRGFAQCGDDSYANVQTVAWLGEGPRAAILASVPDHSICSNMGDYKGFIIDTGSGKIISWLSRPQVPQSWLRDGM